MNTIDIEGCDYYIVVRCPSCRKNNAVEGHSSGHHPLADVLECGYCHEEAWLGVDTEFNSYGNPTYEIGLPFGS